MAAIFCGAFDSVIYIASMRTVIAACIGIINVSAISMLAEAIQSQKKRSTFVGLFNTSMAFICALLAVAAGFLANYS